MTMSTPHVDVAAYVLGILDDPDEATYSQHFAQCRTCRTEFRELADLPHLLDQLKPAPAARKRSKQPAMPSKQVLSRALEEIDSARHGQRVKVWLGAAASIIVLLTVSLLIWQFSGDNTQNPVAQGPSDPTSEPPTTTGSLPTGVASARTVRAENPTTGVSASITMEPEAWGTKVGLELRGVMGPTKGQLVAVSKLGESQVVSNWQVPASGFGVPNSPEPLRVPGSTGLDLENIERFDIRRDNGSDLLVVPTR
jgi:hypothetical protein